MDISLYLFGLNRFLHSAEWLLFFLKYILWQLNTQGCITFSHLTLT